MSTTVAEKTNEKGSFFKLSADGVQNLTVVGILLVMCVIVAIVEPKFLSLQNFSNIFIQISSVVMVSSAVTMVLISGNLDLSVGGIGAMAGVLFAIFARAGQPVLVSAILAVLFGGVIGAVNGLVISTLRLPSFIITMATMYIARGIAYIGAEGAVITAGLPGDFGNMGQNWFGPIPLPLVYTFIIFVAFIFLQNQTLLAKKAYAIGSNIKAAELSGIKIQNVVTSIFTLSGLVAAFAGVVVTSRFAQADCKILPGFEIDCVIASVLGGTDINGGRGTVFGMIIGALIVGVLSNVLNMLGFAIYYQNVIKGIVLVLAIVLNLTIRKSVRV
jgi:ribose/xylose/arabinose/galactoside ABC-type transport system permease subunit